MKKIFIFLFALSIIGFSSCEKNSSDAPGQIPGMGNTVGKLQIKEPFKLPNGILLIGEITGLENPTTKADGIKSVYDSKSVYSCYGSGRNVRLKITLLNSKNYAKTIFFPKGLLWECRNGEFQHGLQCQTSWICIPANTSRTVVIDLYCLNRSIPAPIQTGTYNILGVTSSNAMWNLLNHIGWRKINYEWFFGGNKGVETGPTYDEITGRLQTIVHNLTDEQVGISLEDIAFIESIPELTPEEIPQVDANSQFPEYFKELLVPEK